MTIEQYPSSNNIASTVIWKYTGQGTELVLSGTDSYGQVLNFTPGSEQLFLNGVLLVRTQDYTPAANGLYITLPSSLAYGDFVQIYCYSNYSISTVASSAITGAVQNTQLANSGITIGNQTIGLGQSITIPTGLTLSGSTNTFSNIPNSGLTNSSIIINGNPISLGGTVTITTPNTILSQKGGLIVGTGGGSVAQLTVGADGTSPIADSSQTTNISWAGPINISGKNYLFNGNMESDQRNNGALVTAGTTGFTQILDRWFLSYVSTANITAQRVAGTNTGTQYAQRLNGATGNTNINWSQRIDAINAYNLAGKNVTISMKLYASSAITGAKFFVILPATYDNYSSSTVPIYPLLTVNSGLNNISYTFTMPAGATNGAEIGINFTSGLGNGVYVDISNVQLEIGSIATTFSRSGGSYNGDIAMSGSAGFDGVLVATGSSTSPTNSGTSGWAGYNVAGKNAILNGAFDFNQRNVGAITTGYICDRWQVSSFAGTGTWQRVALAPGSFAGQTANYAIRTSSTSATNDFGVQTQIEDVTTFAGQTVTLSFWAKLSSGSSNIDLIQFGQYFGSGGSTGVQVYADTSNQPYSTTWTKLKYTVTLPSVAGLTVGSGSYLNIRIDQTNTLLSGVYVDIAEMQLEVGTTATRFTRACGNIASELLACQRYYWQGGNGSSGIFNGGSTARYSVKFPAPMRVPPLVTAIAAPIAINPTIAEGQTGSQTSGFLSTAGSGTIDTFAASQIQFGGFSSGADARPTTLLNNCLAFSAELA